MEIDNKLVGHTISKFRQYKGIKAAEAAKYIGMTDSAYTKYERGETAITIDFINKISSFIKVNPVQFRSSTPENIVEKIHDSYIAVIKTNGISEIPSNDIAPALVEQLIVKDRQLAEKDRQIGSLLLSVSITPSIFKKK